MKITAIAPANIAFIKYWGKQSSVFRTPLNDSLSMNISGATTTTTVECSSTFDHDEISFIGETISENEIERIKKHLGRIRKLSHKKLFCRVVTKNSFPKGTGIASSASGFAALTFAATKAFGLTLSEKKLTILARIGSGSACRSIPDGFSWWHKGKTSSASYAESLFPSTWWDLRDILCIVSKEAKKVSTSEGMEGVRTSPFWKDRVRSIPEKIDRTITALKERNIDALGTILEEEAISMHCVMMTQKPPLFYWNDATLHVMDAVYELRQNGVSAYYTMDAGPNVHIICTASDEERVYNHLKHAVGVQSVMINKPAEGAHSVLTHLF